MGTRFRSPVFTLEGLNRNAEQLQNATVLLVVSDVLLRPPVAGYLRGCGYKFLRTPMPAIVCPRKVFHTDRFSSTAVRFGGADERARMLLGP